MDNGNINPRAQKTKPIRPRKQIDAHDSHGNRTHRPEAVLPDTRRSGFPQAECHLLRGRPSPPAWRSTSSSNSSSSSSWHSSSSPRLPLFVSLPPSPSLSWTWTQKGGRGTPVCVCVRVCLFHVRVCAGWHNFSKGESVMSALRLLSCKMTKLFLFFVFRKSVLCYVSVDDDKKKKREKVCEGMLNC